MWIKLSGVNITEIILLEKMWWTEVLSFRLDKKAFPHENGAWYDALLKVEVAQWYWRTFCEQLWIIPNQIISWKDGKITKSDCTYTMEFHKNEQ